MRSQGRQQRSLQSIGIVCAIYMVFCFQSCDAPDPTGPASSARITLTATLESIPADGLSTTTITANVKDERGNNAEGPIYWTTTCGQLDKSADTLSGGVSTLVLTAPNYPCIAEVTADAVHAKKTISINCYSVDARTITVSATPNNIPADGTSRSTISAVVYDTRGMPVADGTTVKFSTTGGVLSADNETTESGRATVTLLSETVPKNVTVTAVVGSVSGSCQVRFYSTQIGRVVLHANPAAEIPADGVSSSIITATVYDVNSNLVEDGTAVYFTTTWGSISASSASTSKGIATVILRSYAESNYDPVARVTAVSGNISAGIDVFFKAFIGTPVPTATPTYTPGFPFPTRTPTPPSNPTSSPVPPTSTPAIYDLTISANPTSIPLDTGTSTITIHLQFNGNDVKSDTVYLSTNNGSMDASTVINDGFGYATLRSSGGHAGEARVTGQCHGVTDTIVVEFTE